MNKTNQNACTTYTHQWVLVPITLSKHFYCNFLFNTVVHTDDNSHGCNAIYYKTQ